MTREKLLLAVATCDGATLARIASAVRGREEDTADKIVRSMEIAKRLGISRRSVSNLYASGALPAVRLPGRTRAIGTRESSLAALIEGKVVTE